MFSHDPNELLRNAYQAFASPSKSNVPPEDYLPDLLRYAEENGFLDDPKAFIQQFQEATSTDEDSIKEVFLTIFQQLMVVKFIQDQLEQAFKSAQQGDFASATPEILLLSQQAFNAIFKEANNKCKFLDLSTESVEINTSNLVPWFAAGINNFLVQDSATREEKTEFLLQIYSAFEPLFSQYGEQSFFMVIINSGINILLEEEISSRQVDEPKSKLAEETIKYLDQINYAMKMIENLMEKNIIIGDLVDPRKYFMQQLLQRKFSYDSAGYFYKANDINKIPITLPRRIRESIETVNLNKLKATELPGFQPIIDLANNTSRQLQKISKENEKLVKELTTDPNVSEDKNFKNFQENLINLKNLETPITTASQELPTVLREFKMAEDIPTAYAALNRFYMLSEEFIKKSEEVFTTSTNLRQSYEACKNAAFEKKHPRIYSIMNTIDNFLNKIFQPASARVPVKKPIEEKHEEKRPQDEDRSQNLPKPN